jgi:predicted O-methyltransferase YrrM
MSQELWDDVDHYFAERLGVEDEALARTVAYSQSQGLPPIQVSATQGKLLELLVQISGARSILEIGTLGGYSTISLARGAGPDGRVITLEVDPHHAEVALTNLEHAGVADRVAIRVGSAVESLDEIIAHGGTSIDFTFIDADKESNPQYLERALALSHEGSLIVVDNVVRDGEVANASTANAGAVGTRAMFDLLHENPRLDATALQTVGTKGYDGVLVAVVIG